MPKNFSRFALLTLVLTGGLIVGAVLGTTFANSHAAPANAGIHTDRKDNALPPPIVTIPAGQDIFEPFILVVKPGTTVTWQNTDTVAHTVLTTPDQSFFLNPDALSLKIAADKTAIFTFTQPGLYHYYEPAMAGWNTTDARVAAKKGVPHYPLAMDGVIWVQGHINNLPSAASNHIPNGSDDFATEFIAINPGTVAWHNYDTDIHLLASVPGLPAPINPVSIGINRIDGTDAVPGGATITMLFTTPGLYYYYCPNHADINTTFNRAEALLSASEYPIPMEGFVLVVN